jgi:serine/threonine-protein kinase
MEYLRGLGLDQMVGRYGPLPAGRVISLLVQACEGLAEAHSVGLIHRDLKPANIFAAHLGRRYDVVKLLDFGLVQDVADESDEPGQGDTVSGTPQYMAPEQVMRAPGLDHRCDLYALGAVAYFLLTGRPPFEGEGAVRLMMAHARDPVVPPSRHCPGVPEDLERVVLRCLAKDPGERYADAEGLRAALASCAAAGGWDARQAARWWQEVVEREATSPISAP